MIESTYNVKKHCNFLYALKVLKSLNFIRKRANFFFLIKFLFMKERCLTNVN